MEIADQAALRAHVHHLLDVLDHLGQGQGSALAHLQAFLSRIPFQVRAAQVREQHQILVCRLPQLGFRSCFAQLGQSCHQVRKERLDEFLPQWNPRCGPGCLIGPGVPLFRCLQKALQGSCWLFVVEKEDEGVLSSQSLDLPVLPEKELGHKGQGLLKLNGRVLGFGL